jgi:hypothetical protein
MGACQVGGQEGGWLLTCFCKQTFGVIWGMHVAPLMFEGDITGCPGYAYHECARGAADPNHMGA